MRRPARTRLLAATLAAPAAATLIAVGLAQQGPTPRPPADLIVLDARVATMDPRRPRATAFAVTDGEFVAVGGPAAGLREK